MSYEWARMSEPDAFAPAFMFSLAGSLGAVMFSSWQYLTFGFFWLLACMLVSATRRRTFVGLIETVGGQWVVKLMTEQRVVPGWLDKGLRHRRARHVERMLVLSPNPALVARLPGGKSPCRKDFSGYKGRDSERLQAWQAALSLGERIADEFRDMLARGDVMTRLQPL